MGGLGKDDDDVRFRREHTSSKVAIEKLGDGSGGEGFNRGVNEILGGACERSVGSAGVDDCET